ncbi:hypothetical protein QUF76_13635 [Desulfobacterales bacterium HSG16]|nr:hypothetical protein [Desulfobacterales bacterium HSG16]
MRKVNFIIAVVFVVFAMVNPCFAGLNQFGGTWKNIDSNTRGITTLKINVSGTTIKINVWGSCTPKDCDWGTVKALAYAPKVSSDLYRTAKALTAEFKTNFNKTLLIVKPLQGKMLQVNTFTHFTSGNRTDYCNVYKFKPVASHSVKEDCIGFNPRTAKVAKKSGHWKIVDGSHWMFDFRNNKAEAVKALKIIKHYGMTKSCFVGRPKASFQYMLANNKGPSGTFPGEDCISFNPNTIAVKKVRGRWKIVDGNHYMFDFDNKKAEAKQAFAIIKKYGFNKSCFVGRPDPNFEYLRK